MEPLQITIEEISCNRGRFENVTLIIDEMSGEGMRFTSNIEFVIDEVIHFSFHSLIMEPLISGKIAWKRKAQTTLFQYGIEIFR